MKNCANCGAAAMDDVENCIQCGREFAYRGSLNLKPDTEALSLDHGERPDQDTRGDFVADPWIGSGNNNRPDGKILIGTGWTLLVFGILIAFVSLSVDTGTYGTRDIEKIAMSWNLLLGGGALAQIGFMNLLVGFVVRAIWFLPGRMD